MTERIDFTVITVEENHISAEIDQKVLEIGKRYLTFDCLLNFRDFIMIPTWICTVVQKTGTLVYFLTVI